MTEFYNFYDLITLAEDEDGKVKFSPDLPREKAYELLQRARNRAERSPSKQIELGYILTALKIFSTAESYNEWRKDWENQNKSYNKQEQPNQQNNKNKQEEKKQEDSNRRNPEWDESDNRKERYKGSSEKWETYQQQKSIGFVRSTWKIIAIIAFCVILLPILFISFTSSHTDTSHSGITPTSTPTQSIDNYEQEAREKLQKDEIAAKENPNDPNVWYELGIDYETFKRPEDALNAYGKSVELSQEGSLDHLFSLKQKARILKSLKRYEEALEVYNIMLEMYPSDHNLDPYIDIWVEIGEVWFNKATIFNNLGRFQEALEAINKDFELDPKSTNNSGNYFVKGLALYGLKQYDESLEAFNHAINLYDGESSKLWKAKSDALNALGRTDEAKEAYNKAIELGYTGEKLSFVQ